VKQAITGGAADSPILQVYGQRMVERDFAPHAKLSTQLKDLGNVLDTAEEIGFEAPVAKAVQQLYARAVEDGLEDLDVSGVFVELAARNGMS
jgi:3-hydroxyisobutyrate dehydrogenase-like beta-hydroxyacid dehydrogenase